MNLQSFRMKSKPEFMIIPMIDIIFVLLVFFMMNSLQTIAQKALSVQLPQATTASAPAQLPVVLTLDADCLLYTSPSPRDYAASRMPSSA